MLIVICGWPWVNDWAWDSAKQEAQTQIAQFETKLDAQVKAQAGSTQSTQPAQPVTVEMSQLTCIAANTFYAQYWQTTTSYRVKLIQAFIWHGYGIEIPSAQSVKERGCGQSADGKYLFEGT